jgi:outer membrane protein OmpA-like peptidoglycan-associated protein
MNMAKHIGLGRVVVIAVILMAMTCFGGACATKKFVRQEVQATTAPLSTRIGDNERGIKENSQQIEGNANQIAELSALNKQNTRGIETLKGEVQRVDGKAGEARSAATRAQETADSATGRVVSLDERFMNRNRFDVLAEKTVYFKFNSWQLDKTYHPDLIEVAAVINQNPDALVVLEGHADHTGDPGYNVTLGEKRLDSVLRYLVVEQEVPIHKIHKMSYGEAKPISDNSSAEGRSKNRCTVIRVLAPGTE